MSPRSGCGVGADAGAPPGDGNGGKKKDLGSLNVESIARTLADTSAGQALGLNLKAALSVWLQLAWPATRTLPRG